MPHPIDAAIKKLYDEYIVRLDVNQTKSCNHYGCPAGEDHKGRLYFTRKDKPTDIVVWFCHNCAEGGAIKTRFTLSDTKGSAGKTTKDETRYIADVLARSVDITSKEGCHITTVQDKWLMNHAATSPQGYYPRGQVLLDPMDGSLVFPICAPEARDVPVPSQPNAMQKRFHRTYGPKCVTTKATGEVKVREFFGGLNGPVVIVEDKLSAIRLLMDTDTRSYVLFGSSMDISELVEYKDQFMAGVIVWLDNDNAQVIGNSHKIASLCRMLGIPVAHIDKIPEPKQFGPVALKNFVTEAKRSLK